MVASNRPDLKFEGGKERRRSKIYNIMKQLRAICFPLGAADWHRAADGLGGGDRRERQGRRQHPPLRAWPWVRAWRVGDTELEMLWKCLQTLACESLISNSRIQTLACESAWPWVWKLPPSLERRIRRLTSPMISRGKHHDSS